MGIDLGLQALPPSNKALEKAISDPEFWEELMLFIPAWETKFKEPYLSYRKENAGISELFSEFPDIGDFALSLSRVYEGLAYLLNPVCESNVSGLSETFEYCIIHGQLALPDHAVGSQGVRARFSEHEFVSKAARYLTSLSIDELRDNFDPKKMAESGLYKCSIEDRFDRYEPYIKSLKDFYKRSAESGYCILHIKE